METQPAQNSSPESSGRVSAASTSSTSEDFTSLVQSDITNRFVLTPGNTISELKEAIETCKYMISESDQCSIERKWLVRHLIELRLRIHQIEDAVDNPTELGFSVAGHHFELQRNIKKKECCDHCCGVIWNVVQGCYTCTDCNYKCHPKCVNNVMRVCAHIIATESSELITAICPERGLALQQYKCAECKTNLKFGFQYIEPRLCDYTGLYYCSTCHWNNMCEIPARIIHNWDWKKRYVSQAAYQLLTLTKDVPLINVENVNEKLFNFVGELEYVRRLRTDLKHMIKYLVACKKGSLLVTTEMRSLSETPKIFSIADLENVKNGECEHICALAEKCHTHISQCQSCSGKGYLCEICGNDEIIYPFNLTSLGCESCNSYFHRACFLSKKSECPKCARIKERKSREECEDDDGFER